MAIWLKDGKLITDANGKPIVCNNCPCGGVECREAVDAQVAALLAEIDPETQAHVWALYGTFEPDYTCAQWHYDSENEEWVLDNMASGKLAIALQYGNVVTDTTNCIAHKFTYAKVLYSVSQHMYKTIGCECHVSDHECKHTKVVRDDYCIAGELDVWQPDESDSSAIYEPSSACEVDPCKLLKLKMETAHYWHGGQLMGEGYYDWLTAPHVWTPENYHYQPFLMAIKWEVETSESTSGSTSESVEAIYNLTFINCECTSITTHTLQSGESCLEYDGICTLEDPCIDMMLLHNKAMENGWIWHGEGVLAHLAKITVNNTDYIGDWYALREQYWNTYNNEYGETGIAYSKRLACAETTEGYYIVGCSCGYDGNIQYKRKDHSLPVSETNPENYWHYFDLEGVCNCDWTDGGTPDRELILSYPDEFGIYDVVFGNHAKYDYSYTYMTSPEPDNPSHEETATGTYIIGTIYQETEGVGQRCLYIDYRCMCFTGKAFWKDGSVKTWIRGIYPEGSEGAPTSGSGGTLTHHYWTRPKWNGTYASDEPWGIYDDVYFRGDYFTPFTHDPDIEYQAGQDGTNFTGFHYGWAHGGEHDDFVNNCQPSASGSDCYWDRDEAEEYAGCKITVPTPCISLLYADGHSWQLSPLFTPDFSVVDHPCSVSENIREIRIPMGDGEYDIERETQYCISAYRWITIGANVGTFPTEYGYGCAWYMYHVLWVKTNKGLYLKGLGYTPSYTLLGSNHYPQYVCRQEWEDPDEPPSGWNDSVISTPVDEDMHWCCEGFDFDLPDESDSSSDSSSSSESVSDSESTSVSEGV